MSSESCYHCGTSLEHAHNVQIYNGDSYCEDCYEDLFMICDECGDVIERESASQCVESILCEDCYSKYASYCDCCDETFDIRYETMTDYDGKLYCESCRDKHLTECESCGNYIDSHDVIHTYNGETICYSCYEDNYFTCERCGEIYHNDYYGGDSMCEDCYVAPGKLHDYSFKPNPIFHTENDPKDRQFIGIEIEIECKDADRKEVLSTWQDGLGDQEEAHFYAKTDGSLDHGIEFVSHPRTLKSWQAFMPKLAEVSHKILKIGVRSHETKTCGLHIHISRNSMNEYHMTRLATFIYSQPRNLCTLARRNSSEYAKFKDINHGCYRDLLLQSTRYEAINWENRNTVEFRFFKGTLNVKTILASIEFVHAAYNFTDKGISIAILANKPKLAWDRLGEYIMEHRARYKHLIEYGKAKLPGWL